MICSSKKWVFILFQKNEYFHRLVSPGQTIKLKKTTTRSHTETQNNTTWGVSISKFLLRSRQPPKKAKKKLCQNTLPTQRPQGRKPWGENH